MNEGNITLKKFKRGMVETMMFQPNLMQGRIVGQHESRTTNLVKLANSTGDVKKVESITFSHTCHLLPRTLVLKNTASRMKN